MRTYPKLGQRLFKSKTLWYLCALTLTNSSLLAMDPTPTPAPDEIRAAREQHLDFKPEDFMPHMVDHPHQGCPVNSSCTKELGAKREKFVSTLKAAGEHKARPLSKVIKKSGAPIPVFVATKQNNPNANYNDSSFIIWDSPCENHRQIGESVYLAEAILKNFSDLKTLPQARAGLILLESTKGPITQYDAPRDHAPRYIDKNALVFLFEEAGHYYTLSVNSKGAIHSISPLSDYPSPENAPCSKALLAQFEQIPPERKVAFAHHFCRSVYNTQTKKRELALLAWSCK